MKFLHAADVHLGYNQYNDKERYNDFGRAFLSMIDAALAARVDFVLLAGDLFHERDLDPRTLLQAVSGLRKLQDQGVPVLTVEGNHERPHWNDAFSWLDYLAQIGLIINLSPWYEHDEMIVAPWSADTHRGAYYDLSCGARVYGCRYYGASTARILEELGRQVALRDDQSAYTILVLHAGVEGVLPEFSGGLTHAQLAPLRPLVDYVALGHIHMPFEHNGWLYNPGSLETNSMQEARWPDRGYFVVDVDPATRTHSARLVRGARRAFVRVECNISGIHTPAEVMDKASQLLATEAARERVDKPVVELVLKGSLAFASADLPLEPLRLKAQAAFDALLARVQNLTSPPEWEVAAPEDISRVELERCVLQQLIERDERRRARSDVWAGVALRLKDMALHREPPERIIAEAYDLVADLAEEMS